MIVDDLDVVSVALFKLETNAPARIHGHRPLMSAITFELVKPDTPQRAQVLQRRCHIERQQQIDRSLEVEAAKPFGRSPSHTLRVATLRHDRIMA
jgi:hypothetical protein